MTVAVGSTVPTGTYTIAVTGTGPYQSHTVNVPLTVNPPPDFSISSDPSSLSITLGSEVHDTIYVTSINGFSGNVTLTQSPSSGAVGCWFTGGASSITLSVPSNGQVSTLPACAGWGPAGSYSVTFTATNGSLTHSVTVPIQVMDFSISGPAVTSTASSSTSATITLSSLNGFAGTVNLSATSSPSGLTVSCPPSATVSSGGSVSASCSFSSSTGGTYVATITGSYAPTNEYYNAPISHSAGLTINILGGFTMSLNPTELLKYCQPYGCPYALQNTSNLTITSIGSFSGTVTLSYIAPNPSGGTTVSGPSSVYVPAGGSATVTVSGTFSNTKNTAFFWTIAGQSGRYSANATLDVYYWVCSRNCPNTKISSTSATSAPASPALASSSITSQSAMSSATATIVNSLTGDSTGLQIVRRPAPTVGVSLSTTSRAS
jgi:hypothetical protein